MFVPACCEIRSSPVHGLGVFAKETIPARKSLGEYTGTRYTLKEFREKYGKDTEHCYVAARYNYVLCAKEERNWITFINESKNPNCRIHAHTLKTLREIQAGEELFLLYPPSYPRTYTLNEDSQ
jgi:SET domain-containing protein